MFTIDYSFYTDTYGGTLIKESDFTRLSDRAIGIVNGYVLVDMYSDYSIDTILDNLLHKAVCAVAEVINSVAASGTSVVKPSVQSESISGVWSKSYAVSSGGNSLTDMYYTITNVLLDYLGGTKLLFMGGFIHG